MRTVYLVSCVGMKKRGIHPAKDLYDSPWFKKARAYVERQGGPWYILSAKYGLLDPDEKIPPYEMTLNNMPAAERRAWARSVLEDLRGVIRPTDHIVFLAGQRYREYLIAEVRRVSSEVSVPMEGLGIGEQLAWLTQRTERSG